jgi:hypothetical protein
MIQRQTIVFFLPLEMEAFIGNTSPYSSATVTATAKQEESSGLRVNGVNPGEPSRERLAPSYNAEGGPPSVSWDRRQLYMNPQSFNISDQKLVQKTLTKGGFVVQYWGEELTTIAIQGTTGSAGIEGINILRDIYRHEQLHYRTVLANRQREVAAAAAAAQANAAAQIYEGNVGGALLGTADALTGGAVSKSVSGVSNTIDTLFGTSLGGNFGGTGGTFRAVPTLAAFATNIDMYYQGEFFRGYFTNFTVNETASEPGHFSYTFNFVVTRRSGKRENFMPWHRNPVSFDGDTVMSQKTTESKGSWPGVDRLSFLPGDSWVSGTSGESLNTAGNPELGPGHVRSEFADDGSAINPEDRLAENQVPNRRNSIKNGSS